MNSLVSKAVLIALSGLLASPSMQAQALIGPAAWLDSQPKPAFKVGHTLPRLTRYGWAMPLNVRKKLCEDWGFALEFGNAIGNGAPVYDGFTYDTAWRLSDPNSPESQMAALAKSNPARYPLSVEITKRLPNEAEAPAGSYARNASGQTVYSGTQLQTDGTTIPAGPVWSLEAPAATWALAAEYRVSGLRELQSRGIPIAYILNGGEYGISHWRNLHTFWEQDSRYNNAVAQSPYGQGLFWEYASAGKAKIENLIADAAKTQVPNRSLYVMYTAGGRTERNRFYDMPVYGGFWEHQRGMGDLPSSETYYRSNGAGFAERYGNGQRDMLTQALNAKALEIQTGNPLSYNWVSAGWTAERGPEADWVAEINRWTGFLKTYYTAGMIGCNVGDYEGPGSLPGGYTEINGSNAGYAASFPNNAPPNFLKHQVASSHVHALFSQVEDIVRNSDLLPGPAQHDMSADVPAYEFPTGEGVSSRVVARKHRTQATWLVTAWAAEGANRNVTVYIPELGQITVEARIVGSVYKVTVSGGNKTMIRIDNEGATYTAVADGTPFVTPVSLTIPPPLATNRLLWLAADSEVTADAAGKVSAWGSRGNSISLNQTDTTKRPTLVANAINGKPALRFVNTKTWLTGVPTDNSFDGQLAIFVVFTGASTNNRSVFTMRNDSQFFGSNNSLAYFDSVTSGGASRKLQFDDKTLTSPMNALMVGDTNQYGAGNYNGLTGDIAEILVYKDILPVTAALVREYLDEKYNLTPYSTVLANGSFESPAVSGYRYTPNQGAGWFFTNFASIQANGSAFTAATAPNGSQTAVLQGFGDGPSATISQPVDLAAGTYTVSFKAARRTGTIQPLKLMMDQVQIGGLITAANDAFTEYTTVPFTVTTGKHILRFEAVGGSGDRAVFIDQVALTQPLTPASAPAIAGGTVFSDSFEVPAVGSFANKFLYNPSGSEWSFLSFSAIQANGSLWNALAAPNGIQTAVLQGAADGLGSMTRTLNLSEGSHTLTFKAARRSGQIQPIRFSVDGVQIGALISATSNSFATYGVPAFDVTAGTHTLKLEATSTISDKSVFIDQVTLVSNEILPKNSIRIKVQAEDFSAMNGITTQVTTDVDGLSEVASVDTGDWLDYTVDVPIAGRYAVNFRMACASSNRQFKLKRGAATLAVINVPNTGSDQAWQTLSVANLPLVAGPQTLQIQAQSGGWRLNWFQLMSAAIQIEAETYAAQLGASYTESGVTAEVTSVTGAASGGWLDFTVNVPNAGVYDIEFGSPNPGASAAFNLQNSSGGSITLAAGSQTLRVNTTASDWNLDWLRLIPRAAATLPAGASYPFAIQQFIRATNGSHTLRFTGDPDRTYRVTRSADMVAPFANLTTPITVKTNLEGSGEVSVPAAAGPQNFYRIER